MSQEVQKRANKKTQDVGSFDQACIYCVLPPVLRALDFVWHYQCWCGLSHNSADFNRHGPGICHVPCTGDESVSCGGNDAFDLFQVIDATSSNPDGKTV